MASRSPIQQQDRARKPVPEAVQVRVTYRSGAYETATVCGRRASSTSSDQRAAEGLAGKLWPGRQAEVSQLRAKGLPAGATVWSLRVKPEAGDHP